MMQRGTGERFKYKEAVLFFYSKARAIKIVNLYIIEDLSTGERLSGRHRRAEDAWADAYSPLWMKYDLIKLHQKLECSKEDLIISDVRKVIMKIIKSL